MARGHFNITDKVPGLRKAGMNRLRKVAENIRDSAKGELRAQISETYKQHGAYKTGQSAGKQWTARHYGGMLGTLRVVELYDKSNRNIRVYAGNKDVWWAKQMEYGRAGWKGSRKSFLRAAIRKTKSRNEGIIKNG